MVYGGQKCGKRVKSHPWVQIPPNSETQPEWMCFLTAWNFERMVYIYMCVCVYMGYQPKNGQHLQCRNSTLSISFWKLWDLSHHYNYRRLASCEGMFTIQELRQLLPHRPVAFGARRTSQFQHMWHVGLSYNGATLYRWMVYNEKSHENGWFRGNPILGKLHMPPY